MTTATIYENMSLISDILEKQRESEKYTVPKELKTSPSLQDYEADERKGHPNQDIAPKYQDPPQQKDIAKSPYVQKLLNNALGNQS